METSIYVGGISYKTRIKTLEELFSTYGEVRSTEIMMDRMTGKNRGFAFITMGSEENARAACASLNGIEFEGRTLTVNIARSIAERPRSEHLTVEVYVDPGNVSVESLQEFFGAVSDLHRAAGGLGLEFRTDGNAIFVVSEVER